MTIQPTNHGRHETAAATYEGRIVNLIGDRLVTNCDGEEHWHTVEPDVKVMRGGSAFKIEDLKPGTRVQITTRKDDHSVAVEVECLPVGQ
jgi:hypothetical protein